MTIIMSIDILCIFFNVWSAWAVLITHYYAFLTVITFFYYQVVQKYQTKLDRLICKYRTFRSKQNYGRMVHFVPIVISEHFRYVQLKYLINDELLSNYLWVAFITNLPTSIYLITKVIYEPMEFAEVCLTMVPWVTQLIVCIFVFTFASIPFKMFKTISNRLYCSQLNIKSKIYLKWKILFYYEMVHSNSHAMAIRMGTFAKITNGTAFKVGHAVYKFIYFNKIEYNIFFNYSSSFCTLLIY